jgi:Flp pilus assembly protein TadG
MHSNEDGSAAVELVVIAPLVLLVIGVFVFAGRLVLARQDVDDAARTALNAAITMPDPQGANTMAGITAYLSLRGDGSLCTDGRTSLVATQFVPTGHVYVQVSCQVPTAQVAFSGLPSAVSITAIRGGLIEPYRQVRS